MTKPLDQPTKTMPRSLTHAEAAQAMHDAYLYWVTKSVPEIEESRYFEKAPPVRLTIWALEDNRPARITYDDLKIKALCAWFNEVGYPDTCKMMREFIEKHLPKN